MARFARPSSLKAKQGGVVNDRIGSLNTIVGQMHMLGTLTEADREFLTRYVNLPKNLQNSGFFRMSGVFAKHRIYLEELPVGDPRRTVGLTLYHDLIHMRRYTPSYDFNSEVPVISGLYLAAKIWDRADAYDYRNPREDEHEYTTIHAILFDAVESERQEARLITASDLKAKDIERFDDEIPEYESKNLAILDEQLAVIRHMYDIRDLLDDQDRAMYTELFPAMGFLNRLKSRDTSTFWGVCKIMADAGEKGVSAARYVLTSNALKPEDQQEMLNESWNYERDMASLSAETLEHMNIGNEVRAASTATRDAHLTQLKTATEWHVMLDAVEALLERGFVSDEITAAIVHAMRKERGVKFTTDDNTNMVIAFDRALGRLQAVCFKLQLGSEFQDYVIYILSVLKAQIDAIAPMSDIEFSLSNGMQTVFNGCTNCTDKDKDKRRSADPQRVEQEWEIRQLNVRVMLNGRGIWTVRPMRFYYPSSDSNLKIHNGDRLSIDSEGEVLIDPAAQDGYVFRVSPPCEIVLPALFAQPLKAADWQAVFGSGLVYGVNPGFEAMQQTLLRERLPALEAVVFKVKTGGGKSRKVRRITLRKAH